MMLAPSPSHLRHGKTLNKVILIVAVIAVAIGAWFGLQEYQTQQIKVVKDQVAKAFATEEWGDALEHTTTWTTLTPNDGEAWGRHANALARLNRHQQAYDALLNVDADFLRYPEILELRANILIRELNAPFQCLKVCDELIELEPSSPAAHHFRVYIGVMLQDSERLEDGLRQAMAAGAETPQMYAYLMMLDELTVKDGAEVTSGWLKNLPDNQDVVAANAVFEFKTAQLDQLEESTDRELQSLNAATKNLESLRQRYSTNPVILEGVLAIAEQQGDTDQIESLLKECDETQRNRIAVQRAYGWLLMQTNRNEEATAIFDQILERRPLSYVSRGMRSEALRAIGSQDEAAAESAIAVVGARIGEDIRALESVEKVSPKLLRQIQQYASKCEDWFTTNALSRRLGRDTSK